MIIIVVIDKLLAFTGPFPIKLSEKLFSSGALRLLSAGAGAGSCSWHWVLMIPEKSFFSFFFLKKDILLLTLLLMSRAYKSHPHLSPPSWRQSFRCSLWLWMRGSCLPAPFSQEYFSLPGIPQMSKPSQCLLFTGVGTDVTFVGGPSSGNAAWV